ncbi:MAG: hypothetical protein M3Q58_11560 [Bacteroidota bacterium]|nr:hypothetical protein [Bacteroidota bacterium]
MTFRIDNRIFQVGDNIIPQNKYQGQLSPDRQKVEELLEKFRPVNKPNRNSILMLFEDFDCAKRHWVKQANSVFYRTVINANQIVHRGDYNKVEQIFHSLTDIVTAENLAQEYWNSVFTFNPIVELFVDNAEVQWILSNSEVERKHEYKLISGIIAAPEIRIRRVTNH